MTDSKRPLWTDIWKLSSDMVNCKECHAGQHQAHRELAFVHRPTCSSEGPGQYPYIELLEVLKMVHYADLPLPTETHPAWLPPKDGCAD
ncbi:hypothetical protein [Pseudomonas baltica]|uniref:hypothetical protein n=1 Tax=Pseudomonas baltica TaxID=2762576 RepID=UPI00289D2855|nr:hypothetical protein [Pseudomonas baltica]